MKKLFTLIMVIFITFSAFSQSPEKMSYQCVVRNPSGVLITNQSVGIKISILQGTPSGTVIYSESYTPNPQTNANGLVTVEIGGGIPITGTFSTINWASGPYYLKTETDPTGGSSYTIIGTSQLLSVPYSLYSKTAGTANYNSLSNLPTLNIANWNAAYGWGNHAGLYRPVGWVPAWGDVTGKPVFATVATSGSYNDLSNRPTLLTPGGATGNVQFNNAGALGGDANFSWDNTSKRLGIGTNSPTNALTVSHGGADGLLVKSTNSFSVVDIDAFSGDAALRFYKAGVGMWNIRNQPATDNLEFFELGGGGSRMIIQNTTGNVGIGDAAPDSKLAVQGTISIGGANTNELNRAQTSTANMVPICYGSVNANGTKNAVGSTSNFTIAKGGTGIYDITIPGETYLYSEYTTIATLIEIGFIRASSIGGTTLRIFTNNTSGVSTDLSFYFVVYKP